MFCVRRTGPRNVSVHLNMLEPSGDAVKLSCGLSSKLRKSCRHTNPKMRSIISHDFKEGSLLDLDLLKSDNMHPTS